MKHSALLLLLSFSSCAIVQSSYGTIFAHNIQNNFDCEKLMNASHNFQDCMNEWNRIHGLSYDDGREHNADSLHIVSHYDEHGSYRGYSTYDEDN